MSPEREALSVLLLLTGPSLVPKEMGTLEDNSSKALTLLVAPGSTAERTPPEGLAPITQEVLEGRWHLVKNSLHLSTKIPPGPARKTLGSQHLCKKPGSVG